MRNIWKFFNNHTSTYQIDPLTQPIGRIKSNEALQLKRRVSHPLVAHY